LGISAKFLKKDAKLDSNTWTEFSLNPAIQWNENKVYGDIHPDFNKLLTNSYDKYSYR